jgi:uncharacterized protein YfkK (UPF0435 family)
MAVLSQVGLDFLQLVAEELLSRLKVVYINLMDLHKIEDNTEKVLMETQRLVKKKNLSRDS